MMTFKELSFFYELCENPHVLEVSKKVHVSQSAVSLAIKSLENKLQEPLFDRIGKRLVLNERGRAFWEETYPSFLKLQEAQTLFLQDELCGNLRCSCSKTIGGYLLPSIMYEFLQTYPKISLKKSLQNSSLILQDLQNGVLDIGFIEMDFESKDLVKEEICTDELIVVSSDKKMKKEFYIDTLLEKNWVLRESGSGTKEVFLLALEELAKSLHVKMEFQDFEEVKNLLHSHSDILTCLSSHVVKRELERGEFVHVKIKNIKFERKFYCVYHKNKVQSRVFQVFKEFVLKRVKLLS
jgi:DNA-binding transcriptional LysR family regulator